MEQQPNSMEKGKMEKGKMEMPMTDGPSLGLLLLRRPLLLGGRRFTAAINFNFHCSCTIGNTG